MSWKICNLFNSLFLCNWENYLRHNSGVGICSKLYSGINFLRFLYLNNIHNTIINKNTYLFMSAYQTKMNSVEE